MLLRAFDFFSESILAKLADLSPAEKSAIKINLSTN
jgi:hypothetical protein